MKVLISGYYGFGNFGDELILSCLCSHLKLKNINVSVLSSNPKYTSVNNGVDAFYSFDFKALPDLIKKHDILISGGGSLLQDVTSKKSLIYYLIIIFLALFFKKKVIIFAQGIGPISDKFLFFITKLLLKHCSYVSVRDEKSLEVLNNSGIDADLLCDPAFSISLPEYKPNGVIGVQLRDFPSLDKNDLKVLVNHILSTFPNSKIELICFQDAYDYEISKYFEKLLKECSPSANVEILHGLTNQEIIYKMSSMEYLYAMRFHAIVIALMYGIKTVAINYDAKVEKLAKEVDISLLNLDFSNIKDINWKHVKFARCFDWSGFDRIIGY